MVSFVKEFENYILSDFKEDSLLTIVPGSEAELYLQILNKLKSIKDEFPKEIDEMIEKFEHRASNVLASNQVKILALLTEYEIPDMKPERKIQIINKIKDLFFPGLRFDYPKPANVINTANQFNDGVKYDNILNQECFNPSTQILELIQREDFVNLINKFNPQYIPNYLNFDIVTDKNFSQIMDYGILNNLPLYELGSVFLERLTNYLNKKCEELKSNFNIQYLLHNMTLSQIEKIYAGVTSNFVDKNMFLSEILNKKYMDVLYSVTNRQEKREILINIYNFLSENQSNSSSLKSDILLQLLENGTSLNIYDLDLFKEYLKNPVLVNLEQYIQKKEDVERIKKQIRWNISNLQNKNLSDETKIIRTYLTHFFLEKRTEIEEFMEFFQKSFLNKIYYEALILRGEEGTDNEKIIKTLNESEYERIVNQTYITICPHNKEIFNVDELVTLEVDIKNVQTLFIKIFEINTENYYYNKKTAISSSISLEGLIATYEEPFSFNEKPQRMLRRKFELDKVPNKRGIYIIELIGNGYSSRALIKKGGLSLVSRPTSFGKMLFILNERSEICKTHVTGVWVKNSFYEADKKNGSIIIPYMKTVSTENAIIVSENFAELAQLQLTEENYSLTGSFYVNHESIIMGNTAKVLFRPFLFINNRITDLKLIKNPKITVKLTKVENDQEIPITNVFEKITVNYEKEVEFEVQIPPKLQNINFVFECEVYNHSKDKQDKLIVSENFNMMTNMEDNTFIKMFLRKVDNNNHILSVLGKNGEPKPNILVNVSINHKVIRNIDVKCLQTNINGEVILGPLTDVSSISVNANYMNQNINQNWNINEKPDFSYPQSIDIVEGDKIVLPYYTNKFDIETGSFLRKTDNGKLIDNLIDCVKVVKLEDDNRFQMEILSPQSGKYYLSLKSSGCTIIINVHKGKIWETSNFIILKDKIIENSEYRFPIHFKMLKLEEEMESETYTLNIKVNKNALYPRVHLMAYQFAPNNINKQFFNSVITNLKNQTLHSSHLFQNWINIYLSNRQMHEEIQYVFDRKHMERFMGNSLEKPSLLLKRTFVRDTVTEEKNVKEGTEYDNIAADVIVSKQMAYDAPMNDFIYQDLQSNKMAYSSNCNLPNTQLSSFHNFLSYVPIIANNLKPDKEGNIIIPKLPLNRYSHLQVIAVDERSICDEIISLKQNPINKKNLSLSQPLNLEKFFSEIRNTELISKGSVYNINDITSTSFKLLDSLESVVNYQIMINASLKDEWSKFNFLFKFSDMNENERLKNFSKNFCHEVNIFLYFKYPQLFANYVQPVLKYKIEKTFIDFFLLNDRENLLNYCKPNNIIDLNSFEKCLLIYAIRKENPQLAENIASNLQACADLDKPVPQEFKRLFNVMMNMKAEVESNEFNDFKNIESFSMNQVRVCSVPQMPMQERMTQNNMAYNMFSRVQRDMARYEEAAFRSVEDEQFYNDNFDMCEKMCCEEMDDVEFSNRNFNEEKIQKMNIRNNLYKEAGKSKEYAETHYSKHWFSYPNTDLIKPSLIWADLAKYWSSNVEVELAQNFLSKNILLTVENVTELICVLSIIDLPITSSSHNFNRKDGRGLEITANSNIILFTKEIKETTSDIKSHLMIAQHLSLYSNKDKSVKELLVGEIYCHETIVTNISSSKLTFELLIQVPQGAIPVCNSEYTKTISLTLDNFKTSSYLTYFYFPAKGEFTQFPPNASIDGVVIAKGTQLVYKFLDLSNKKESHESLDDVLISGSKQDIMNFIESKEDLKNGEWGKIYWLLKERDFFNFIIETMRNRGIYDQNVWNFGFYHKDENTIREMLEGSVIKTYLGPKFNSSLVKFDNTNDYDLFPHLDYHPIINARAHKLGKESNLGIMNKEFKETYEKFIIYLLRLNNLDSKDYLRLCYYLILQDRNEDAIKVFSKVDLSSFNDTSSLQVQYDYISAYLDFTTGYPEFKVAKELCKKYRDFPLTHWRELFEEIDDQFIEYEGLEVFSDVDSLMDDEKRKKQLTKNIEINEPRLTFKIENQELHIRFKNIKQITVKFYLIDLEILFSRTPFIQSNSDDFSFVQPNFIELLDVTNSNKEETHVFKIPEEYISRNLFIEVSSLSNKCFNTYFSTSLNSTISEELGEIKITDKSSKPLNKVYVKCFAKMNDESIKFYKDGYTDLRGKFNFVSLNTDQLQQLKRFSIFVMHDEYGSMIKECNPPSNIKRESGINSDYDAYIINRQQIKEVWRSKNKK